MTNNAPAITIRTTNPGQEVWSACGALTTPDACAIHRPMLVAKVMPRTAPMAKAYAASRGTFLSLDRTRPSTRVSGLNRMASARVASTTKCELIAVTSFRWIHTSAVGVRGEDPQ